MKLIAMVLLGALSWESRASAADPAAGGVDFEAMRQRTLEKVQEEQALKEATPEFKEKQRKLEKDREKAVALLRKSGITLQARVLAVQKKAILAAVRIKRKVSGGKGKPRYRLDEVEHPQNFWIEGVDTKNVVDGDTLDLTVYVSGKHSYTAVDGSLRTVRRLHTDPEVALNLALTGQ